MLPAVRVGLVVLLVLAIANGVFLYFFPSRAEPDYAWAIVPPVSAALMGAGYLAGCLGASLGLFAAVYWRSVSALVVPFCVLAVTLLAATLIDADRFRLDYPLTWGWLLIYAGITPGALYLRRLQERAGSARPPRDERLRPLLTPLQVTGAVVGVVGVLLYAAPDWFRAEWPWEITPLMSRIFGGWYLLVATALLISPAIIRRPHEIPIPYANGAAWSGLILVLPALYSETVRTDGAGFWVWLGIHAAVFVVCAWAVAGALVLVRADGERL